MCSSNLLKNEGCILPLKLNISVGNTTQKLLLQCFFSVKQGCDLCWKLFIGVNNSNFDGHVVVWLFYTFPDSWVTRKVKIVTYSTQLGLGLGFSLTKASLINIVAFREEIL